MELINSVFHVAPIFFFIFFITKYFVFQLQLRQDKSRNGPLAFPIIGHLHLIKQPLHQCLRKISAAYGQVLFLRFGSRTILLVSSASAAEECFTTSDIIFANRPFLLAGKYFGYEYSMIGVAPYGPHWRNLRRFTALHVVSSSRLFALSSFFSDEVHSLLHRLFIDVSPTIDLRSHVWELVMNIMMGMIAGKRYHIRDTNTTNPNPNSDEAMRFRRIVEEVFKLSGAASMEDFIPVMKLFSGMEKKMEKLGKEMDELLQDLVEERRKSWRLRSSQEKEIKEERVLIDVMLGLQESQPEEYTDKLIKGMIIALILAGTETSATSIEWAMALLLNHPQTLKKVKSEIKEHIGHERLVKDTDIPKLNYLNNVIKETLRLYPPAPLLIPHESSKPCTISGLHVPENTILIVNAYAIQRDPKLWGTDSMEFKPERFEGYHDDDDDGDKGLEYMPFGHGRRRCPGEGMAMKVVGLVLASLIQCFEWERVGEEMVSLDEVHGLAMPMATPLHAKIKPCLDMVNALSQLSGL
ncbi:putative isoflavone 2'-hydroxylase [Dioscorea sansibarensis]